MYTNEEKKTVVRPIINSRKNKTSTLPELTYNHIYTLEKCIKQPLPDYQVCRLSLVTCNKKCCMLRARECERE